LTAFLLVTRVLYLVAALILSSAQERLPRLDVSKVKVETIREGIGKGQTAFTILDGEDKGVLRYDSAKRLAMSIFGMALVTFMKL